MDAAFNRLLLLDLDGVLLDSQSNMEIAWTAVRNTLGVSVTFEEYFEKIGAPFGDILNDLGIGDQLEEIEPIFRTESMKALHKANFFPEVEETLLLLVECRIKLGVVTSKDKFRTNAVLAQLPVTFVTIQTPEDKYRGKPAPDHLLIAMAEANADPCDTVYMGDMDADFHAAHRADIRYAHAAWGYGDTPEGQRLVLNKFSEIIKVMES